MARAAASRSSSRPSRGVTTTGLPPSKVTAPSRTLRSIFLARAVTVLCMRSESTEILGASSVVPVSARQTSIGAGKPLCAWSIVATTSNSSPAFSGSMEYFLSTARTTISSPALPGSRSLSLSAASVAVSPPMSTPWTRVPGSILPDMTIAGTA